MKHFLVSVLKGGHLVETHFVSAKNKDEAESTAVKLITDDLQSQSRTIPPLKIFSVREATLGKELS